MRKGCFYQEILKVSSCHTNFTEKFLIFFFFSELFSVQAQMIMNLYYDNHFIAMIVLDVH